jgi:4-aminobutyrate aminotransferase-like enzyme
MGRLLHAMGDVHPHRLKAQLARELSRLTFERWTSAAKSATGAVSTAKTIFCNSGFEAVEAALKTAILATGKPGLITFEGAYHGLGYGALNATYRDHFRSSFKNQIREFGKFVSYPCATADDEVSSESLEATESQIRGHLAGNSVGAILVEPIQVRGGIRIPPTGFLPMLRRMCNQNGILLILDEIYTGFGRTGKWFACEHAGVVPDLVCLGKSLTGGFPLSACVGRAKVMDRAWPPSNGEAIHTSTFLGHPVGCAMALANIREIHTRGLVERSAKSGDFLFSALSKLARSQQENSTVKFLPRGLGLLAGLEVLHPNGLHATKVALAAIKTLLHRGFILLPEGEHGNVISFTPPLTISKSQLQTALDALDETLPGLPP